MRLFVALAMPREVGARLEELVTELRRADAGPRWVEPANLHITLKFIGHVAPDRLASIEQALSVVRLAEPVALELRDIGFFPDARRPKVVWAGIAGGPALARLAGEIDRGLAGCGIAPETRPFVPHLTLGRFTGGRVAKLLREEIERARGRSFGTFSAAEFHLMESKLRSGGAEYTTQRSFRFAEQGIEG